MEEAGVQEVRYEEYDGRERQTTRFFHNEQEREELPFIVKAGMGVAVAAGVLSAGHRTGAMRKIARFLDTEGKATVQAFRDVKATQGSLYRGQDKATLSRINKLKNDFISRQAEISKELKRVTAPSNILESRKFQMQHELELRRRLVGRKKGEGDYEGEVAHNIQEGYRFSAIMDDLRQNTHLQNQPDVLAELEKALAKGDLGILNYGTKEQMKLLLKNHQKGVDSQDVLDVLENSRAKFKDANFSLHKDDAYKVIEGMQVKIADTTAELMTKATKSDGKIKNFIIGHKQATVQDILDLNKEGRIHLNDGLKVQINDVLKRNSDFGKAVFDDNLYLSTKNGELFDYKTFSNAKRSTADWWANTIPGGILHLRDILNVKTAREQAGIKIFQRGTVLSSLNGHRGIEATEALNEEVVFMYGKFVKLNDVDAIESDAALKILNPNRDMYLTSSSFGTTGKMHRQMSGLMTDNESARNPILGAMDIGRQDKDSMITQAYSVFSKFFKKDWERNKIKNVIDNGIESPQEFFELNTYFKLNTQGFSARVLNNLESEMPKHIRDFISAEKISFSNNDDMLKLFSHIGKLEKGKTHSAHTDFQKLFGQYDRNPANVLNRKTPIGESNPLLGHHTRLRTGQDEINQQISLYLSHEIMNSRARGSISNVAMTEAKQFRQDLKKFYADGKISAKELDESEQLLNYSMFRSQGAQIFKARDSAIDRVNKLFKGNDEFRDSMRKMVRKTNPIWERHSSITPENLVGDEFIAVNQANIGGAYNEIFGINRTTQERLEGLKKFGKQVSPFTGRGNLEDATTLTMYGVYYPVYRLQDALGNIGLGFSDKSMENTAQMFGNLMLKRIAPVYLGVEGAKYADWKMDEWTGEGLDERWENYKANNRLEEAMTRTEFEIEEEKRKRMLRPGIEHWEAMPEIHLPGLGPVSMGDALNNVFALSPTFDKVKLREEDMMTYDETLDDLYNGTEEIRKSRYWLLGSKSAYRGDRISEFAPNSFRQAHSDYEWTNTGATGEEYWGNHILPTLENPLGGLSFALGLRDPYWYERKHYHDRPYMLTGELFNPNTMILGDIGNATIGRLVKPVKEMHPEYWSDPQFIYDNETSQLGERPMSPVRTEVSPAGRAKHEVLATPSDYGAEQIQIAPTDYMNPEALANIEHDRGQYTARYFISNQLDQEGNQTGAYVAQDMQTNQSMYVPANVAKENIPIGELFAMAQEDVPDNSQVKVVSLASQNPSYQTQISTQPRAMFDEEYGYKQETMYRKMDNIRDPRDSSWRVQEAIENWTEPLGVYKWIMNDEILGRDPYTGETVIQRADAAYNTSNRFWESELGSLGSQMSEIGRRFIRRDDGKLDQYNPIRNTMPEWMPGDNYFINFQIGDPYSKVPHGERRLPGEAYESLNELHTDETGRYGAFDKFKILADVAPWSDEYKFWSNYLMETLPDGDLRKEATQIRKQVSQRKQKYDFQPYKFRGNNVVYEEVTVDKFLDDYTFTTKELVGQPVRIAGMEYRKKADGVLQQYFREGDKITIAVAEDESQRIAKDTYGTMRAAIFNELGNINQNIIARGEMAENKNDFSAAGIHARFTPKEIKQAERWEAVAHTSSPLNTKFLQVRTAVEEYERDQIYGKDWATWENFMMSDYIMPTIEGLGRFDNPIWSGFAGAVTGGVISRLFLKGGRTAKVSIIAGALTGIVSNIGFKNYEKENGKAWIPERRRTENDINEYFDILKFLKYEGLYQKAREEIAHHTGYDVEDFAEIIDNKKKLTKERRRELESEKKRLFLEQPDGWEDRKKEINQELTTISEDFDSIYLPESFLQALNYKEERDTTLYGIDPHEDRMKVMRAFPTKDKWFFSEFAAANKEDREKILKLIPDNQRRIYQALWGMEAEDKKPLEYYMEKYDIPHWDWEGWKPEYDLESIKVKAVQEAGINMSDFNFWDDDVAASRYVPNLQENGRNQYQGEAASNFEGFSALRQNIANILQGQGLYDVTVTVNPSDGHESYADINYREDRSKEIQEQLRMNGQQYI